MVIIVVWAVNGIKFTLSDVKKIGFFTDVDICVLMDFPLNT